MFWRCFGEMVGEMWGFEGLRSAYLVADAPADLVDKPALGLGQLFIFGPFTRIDKFGGSVHCHSAPDQLGSFRDERRDGRVTRLPPLFKNFGQISRQIEV